MLRCAYEIYLKASKTFQKRKKIKSFSNTLVLFDELIMQRCRARHLIKTFSTQRVQWGQKSRRVTKQKKRHTYTHSRLNLTNRGGARRPSRETRDYKKAKYIFLSMVLFLRHTPHYAIHMLKNFIKYANTPLIILSFFSILI